MNIDGLKKNLLNENLLKNPEYCNFLDFLYESRLIHSVRGYETSLVDSDSALKEGIRSGSDGPEFFKQGAWVNWAAVSEELHYNKEQQEILTRTSEQEWNYIYPNGLTPQSRYNWIEPVYKLSATELKALSSHGAEFSGMPNPLSVENTAGHIQIFTDGKNRREQLGHVGFRMINKAGNVYSLGFERPNKEVNQTLWKIFFFLSAYNATIAAQDFREFRSFNVRQTTTIPVSLEQFNLALEKVKTYAANPIRFHMLHQNCATFTADILKTIGIPGLDVKASSLTKMLYEVLVEDIAYLGPCIKKIGCVSGKISKGIAESTPKPIRFIVEIMTFVLCSIFNVFKNSLLLILGAGREGFPLPEKLPEDTEINKVNNSENLTLFKRLFNNWTDIFKEDTVTMSFPYKVSDWQKKQQSTDVVNTYKGPKYYIVP